MSITESALKDQAVAVMALLRAGGVPSSVSGSEHVRLMTSFLAMPGHKVIIWGVGEDGHWAGTVVDEDQGGEITRVIRLEQTFGSHVEEIAKAMWDVIFWGSAAPSVLERE